MKLIPKEISEIHAEAWLVAAGLALLVFFGLLALRGIFQRRLSRGADRTGTLVDDLVLELARSARRFFFLALAIYVGASYLALPAEWMKIVGKGTILVVLLQFFAWANVAAGFWVERYLQKRAASDAQSATTVGLISFAIKALILVSTVLLALNNLGVDITALIAGLGVGGVAVALALQNILGDLFASLTIVLDKPFIVGDFIIVGDFMGTIEHIGLKTTRIRSLSGEQLIFANGDLLQSRIRNYKRMRERRVVLNVGVTYDTPRASLEAIPGIVRAAVESRELVRFERCHFLTYGDSALNFEIVYWVNSADFNVYADVAQAINLDLFSAFQERGIDFAHPTRTLRMAGASRPARPRATEGEA